MILPIVILSLNVLTFMSNKISSNSIMKHAYSEMVATLGEYTNSIGGELDVIKAQAVSLASAFEQGYKGMKPEQIKGACIATAMSNDMILGSGIWFEPNVYDKSKEYYGPYWYKELDDNGKSTGNILEEWGYSNAEYDYFSQEYYTLAKSLKHGEAVITDPYYDETSNIVMASCRKDTANH